MAFAGLGLPGHVRSITPTPRTPCEFVLWEGVKEKEGQYGSCECPATKRLQGETDSFGAEYTYYCEEHLEMTRQMWASEPDWRDTASCDWCKKGPRKCRETRDPDEGMGGPVYLVCEECQDRVDKELAKELEEDARREQEEEEQRLLDLESLYGGMTFYLVAAEGDSRQYKDQKVFVSKVISETRCEVKLLDIPDVTLEVKYVDLSEDSPS